MIDEVAARGLSSSQPTRSSERTTRFVGCVEIEQGANSAPMSLEEEARGHLDRENAELQRRAAETQQLGLELVSLLVKNGIRPGVISGQEVWVLEPTRDKLIGTSMLHGTTQSQYAQAPGIAISRDGTCRTFSSDEKTNHRSLGLPTVQTREKFLEWTRIIVSGSGATFASLSARPEDPRYEDMKAPSLTLLFAVVGLFVGIGMLNTSASTVGVVVIVIAGLVALFCLWALAYLFMSNRGWL